jgi:hypothetical protein
MEMSMHYNIMNVEEQSIIMVVWTWRGRGIIIRKGVKVHVTLGSSIIIHGHYNRCAMGGNSGILGKQPL